MKPGQVNANDFMLLGPISSKAVLLDVRLERPRDASGLTILYAATHVNGGISAGGWHPARWNAADDGATALGDEQLERREVVVAPLRLDLLRRLERHAGEARRRPHRVAHRDLESRRMAEVVRRARPDLDATVVRLLAGGLARREDAGGRSSVGTTHRRALHCATGRRPRVHGGRRRPSAAPPRRTGRARARRRLRAHDRRCPSRATSRRPSVAVTRRGSRTTRRRRTRRRHSIPSRSRRGSRHRRQKRLELAVPGVPRGEDFGRCVDVRIGEGDDRHRRLDSQRCPRRL